MNLSGLVKGIALGGVLVTLTACGNSGPSLVDTNRQALKDELVAQDIPQNAIDEAFEYFDANRENIDNQEVMVFIDFALHSSKKRFHILDLYSGVVTSYLTSHGEGSDKDRDGYAESFSNVENSYQSSLGFYLTAETYWGKHGYSLKLDGVSDTNFLVRQRYIVIHPADYIKTKENHAGLSQGCPALDPEYSEEIIDLIKGGALMYAFL